MRVGVFGGTFDPVHVGHLILAEQCREQARLDQVWFVPSARPPHKPDPAPTPFERRAEMLALAVAGHPAFRVEEIEKDRPGPSFTADTLEELHRRRPDDELFLLLGSDSLRDLPGWHAPERILRAAGLVVVERPGHPILRADQLRTSPDVPVRLQAVASPLIEVASSDLRERAASGRSLRYLVPRAVEAYILEKRLYRTT
jgi:nicotinate-nucleotide adenylyltransferase